MHLLIHQQLHASTLWQCALHPRNTPPKLSPSSTSHEPFPQAGFEPSLGPQTGQRAGLCSASPILPLCVVERHFGGVARAEHAINQSSSIACCAEMAKHDSPRFLAGSPVGSCLRTLWPGSTTAKRMPGEHGHTPGCGGDSSCPLLL